MNLSVFVVLLLQCETFLILGFNHFFEVDTILETNILPLSSTLIVFEYVCLSLLVTGVCAQTPCFTDKDTILSHMGRYKGLKIFMVFDSVSFVRNNTALKSSLKPLNMHVKIL